MSDYETQDWTTCNLEGLKLSYVILHDVIDHVDSSCFLSAQCKCPESLESDGQIAVIYTDLEKAFHKLPHKRLISILYSYKINPEVIKWIESFLVNGRQRVRVNGFVYFWR